MRVHLCPRCDAALEMPPDIRLKMAALPIHDAGHKGGDTFWAESLDEREVCPASEQLADIEEKGGDR